VGRLRPNESGAFLWRRRKLLAAGAGLGLMGYGNFAFGQSTAHPNALSIARDEGNILLFQFSLNLPQVLHQLLSPAMPLSAFLQNHAHMPPPAWERTLQNAKRLLSDSGILTLPGGRPIRLQAWQWPDDTAIAQSLKAQEILLPIAEASRLHLDPVPVQARLQTSKPIRQAQLQLPKALYPIEVTIKNDKFWLTTQIPLAMVNLE